MTTSVTYADLMDDARALRAEIEERGARLRGETPAPQLDNDVNKVDVNADHSRPARLSDDPASAIRVSLEQVRSRRHSFDQDRNELTVALAENSMYSDEYKRDQAENFRDLQAREAESVASLAWRRIEALEADLVTRHAEAERQVDHQVDHARVAGMTRDLEARLAVGPSAAGVNGNADRVALAPLPALATMRSLP